MQATGTPQPRGTFVVALAFSGLLDTPESSNEHTVMAPALSRLLRFKTGLNPEAGRNHDLEPDLALSVESPDAVTWTAKLRPDAKWHTIAPASGRAVEAEDVKATFTRARPVDRQPKSRLDQHDRVPSVQNYQFTPSRRAGTEMYAKLWPQKSCVEQVSF